MARAGPNASLAQFTRRSIGSSSVSDSQRAQVIEISSIARMMLQAARSHGFSLRRRSKEYVGFTRSFVRLNGERGLSRVQCRIFGNQRAQCASSESCSRYRSQSVLHDVISCVALAANFLREASSASGGSRAEKRRFVRAKNTRDGRRPDEG